MYPEHGLIFLPSAILPRRPGSSPRWYGRKPYDRGVPANLRVPGLRHPLTRSFSCGRFPLRLGLGAACVRCSRSGDAGTQGGRLLSAEVRRCLGAVRSPRPLPPRALRVLRRPTSCGEMAVFRETHLWRHALSLRRRGLCVHLPAHCHRTG